MGLIINDSIPMFKVGYPTMSDKYNVTGGTLVGSASVAFGSLVKFSSTKGYYEAITSTVTLADIAGFILATNVKLANDWPATTWAVNPGEAFNLVLPGSYLAVELDESCVANNIAANKAVAVFLNTSGKYGKLTTTGVSGATDLPGVVFTGMYEVHGTTKVAEILVK